MPKDNKEHDWRPPVGTRVLITHHPYYSGRAGVIMRHDRWLGRPAVAVKLDTGETPGVMEPEQIQVIDA